MGVAVLMSTWVWQAHVLRAAQGSGAKLCRRKGMEAGEKGVFIVRGAKTTGGSRGLVTSESGRQALGG